MRPFLILALCLPSVAHAAAPLKFARDGRLEARIDAYARSYVDAGHLAGQLVVARNGVVVAERSWGLANRETGTRIDADTRINIASLTKPMTWTVAHKLIDEGKMSESDSVAKWIPGFHSAQ